MCNVCGALMLIRKETLKTKSIFTNQEYEIRGSGEGAEFKPAVYSLRKNNGEWSKDFSTNHLAGVVSKGGFDIKNEVRRESADNFLESHF